MSESLRTVDIIAAKRDGRELSEGQIAAFIKGYADGSIPDYQAAAWCMATFLNGMTPTETGYLTRAMIDSGEVIDLSGLTGPFVDKHSTGGVGDKISLVLAPIAAACGVRVPMMSGRALGHTGGTLDKLESIPGYTTALEPDRFARIVDEVVEFVRFLAAIVDQLPALARHDAGAKAERAQERFLAHTLGLVAENRGQAHAVGLGSLVNIEHLQERRHQVHVLGQ